MSRNLKVFLTAFLISLPFWWSLNVFEKNLEEGFFGKEITENPQILTAQLNSRILEEQLRNLKPIRDKKVEKLEIEAKSAISVLVREGLDDKILFEKEIDKKLPIASLTKLMTAQIVLENYDLEKVVAISERAVREEGEFGNFKIGENFFVKDLLYSLLMESSNDAAFALSELIGPEKFLELMNQKSKDLELGDTYFVNPTGLDPDEPGGPINYSTVKDLVKLTKYLLKTESLIWEILATPEFDFYSSDEVFHHKISNTNQFLESTDWKTKILGGKTGWTPQARGCLLLVVGAPKGKGDLINVILGSKDRFGEMKKLVDWVNKAHKW